MQNIKLYFFIWILIIFYEKLFLTFYTKILFFSHFVLSYFYIVFNYFANNNLPLFWDMQSFLQLINCNYDYSYEFKFLNTTKTVTCIEDMGFGPLSFLLSANLDTVQITITFSILYFLFITYVLYKKFGSEDFVRVSLLFLSPSFLFLFESLNPDIFILIFFIYIFLIRNQMDNINILHLLLLTLFTQLKIYTLAILVGILIYKYLEGKNFKDVSFVIFINIILLTYHYFVLDKVTPHPSSINRTFGLLSDFYIFKNSFGINYYVLFLTFSLFFIFINRNDIDYFKNLENKEYSNFVILVYIPMIILILIFANYGYKFVFVILFFTILPFDLSIKSKLILYFSFISTPLLYLFGYDYAESLLNLVFFALNRLSHHYILFICTSMFINLIISNLKLYRDDVT